jgi:ribonuclease VapC
VRVALDSSALVAILNREPEALAFSNVIAGSAPVIGWPTLFETRIWVLRHAPYLEVWLIALVEDPATILIDFGRGQEQIARDAYQRFGRGKHPAALNYGDCMTYAIARAANAPLLFKGSDFGQTDLPVHPASVLI